MTQHLAQRVAVVTGSSRGIGRQTALLLASAGAKVIVHAGNNRAAAEEVAAEITRGGGQARVLVADFTRPESRRSFAEEAWACFGHVDICVLCAGADILSGPHRALSFADKLHLLWQVDVLGTVEVAREFGRLMRERGQGTILTVGWDGAFRGMEGDTAQAFAVVKGAVMAFSLALAQELAPQVRVNCVAPGWIRTAWGQSAKELWQQRVHSETLLGRWGHPEEVARVCLFLVSPESSFINSQIIFVNGGTNYRFPRNRTD